MLNHTALASQTAILQLCRSDLTLIHKYILAQLLQMLRKWLKRSQAVLSQTHSFSSVASPPQNQTKMKARNKFNWTLKKKPQRKHLFYFLNQSFLAIKFQTWSDQNSLYAQTLSFPETVRVASNEVTAVPDANASSVPHSNSMNNIDGINLKWVYKMFMVKRSIWQ